MSSKAKDQNRVLALNAEHLRVSVSSSPLGVSDLHATGEQADLPKKARSFVPWTTEQAFFAVTGGLAVKRDSFWHAPRIALMPEGVVLLAEMGLLPSFSQAEVEERSQADIIAKLLVCLHALWFLVQSFARVVQGLPLTLLEVHTMTHIVCALGMYMIWLRKGYNIRNPIVLEDKRIISIAALKALRADDTTWEFFETWDGWPFHDEEDDNESSESDNDGIDSPEDDELYDYPLMKAMADGVDFNNTIVLLMYRSWSIVLASYPMNDLKFVDRESQIKYLSSSDAPFRNRINHFQAQELRGLDKAGFPLQKSSRCSQQPANIDVNMVRLENKSPNKTFSHLEAANNAFDYLRENGYHFR